MLRSFKIALGFLTIIKIDLEPYPTIEETGKSAWLFPFIGISIGLLLVFASVALNTYFSTIQTSILVLSIWVIWTGGLHLDGWCDSWDALACMSSRERRLEIIKDSRLGSFGAIALIILLALKGIAIYGASSLLPIFAAPIIGRAMMVIIPYGSVTGSQGIGSIYVRELNSFAFKVAVGFFAAACLINGFHGILAGAITFFAGMGFRKLAEKRLGFMNGDIIGALCELSETIFLLIATGAK